MKYQEIEARGSNGKTTLDAAWVGETFAVTKKHGKHWIRIFKITHLPTTFSMPGEFTTIKRAKAVALLLEKQPQWKRLSKQPGINKTKLKYRALYDLALGAP